MPDDKQEADESTKVAETLQSDLNDFANRVIDLNYGFPVAMGWASVSGLLHQEEVRQFAMDHGDEEKEGDSTRYLIPIDYVTRFKSLERRRTASRTYFNRMPGFYIEAIIEELDLYVGDLIEVVLVRGGAGAKLSDKEMTYAELLKFSSFEEARDYLIGKEVDRVLRSGIAEQVEWFNAAGFKIPLDHHIVLRCIEVGERRNCIVHASCEANRFYIQNCKSRGVDTGKLKEGDSLRPDQRYCDAAFESLLVFGCMLFCAAWIKLCKKEDKDWDQLTGQLNSIVYDLMLDGLYGTAQTLLNFILDDLKISLQDLDRRLFKVNLALCAKELNDKRSAFEILNSEDWRATDLRFQSAVSAIRGDTDETLRLLRAGYAADQIDKQALIDWPVFNHVRQLKKFKKLYSDLLGQGEAERALSERIEARAVGVGMRKIVNEAVKGVMTLQKQRGEADGKIDDAAGVAVAKGGKSAEEAPVGDSSGGANMEK